MYSSISTNIYAPENIIEVLSNLKNAPFSTYFKWLDAGRTSLERVDKEVRDLFEFIMQGNIENDRNKGGLIYKYSENNSVSINQSSAMVEEITGIMLPIISSSDEDLIIIEEPEAQLHITTQIIMGILLVYISRKMNLKIIFSTHSDTMAFLMHYIVTNNIDGKKLRELMEKIYDIKKLKEGLNILKNKSNNNVIFYYIKDGKSSDIKDENMEANIPGITNIINDLFDWVFNSLKNYGDKN